MSSTKHDVVVELLQRNIDCHHKTIVLLVLINYKADGVLCQSSTWGKIIQELKGLVLFDTERLLSSYSVEKLHFLRGQKSMAV